jgi:hypothetical protein
MNTDKPLYQPFRSKVKGKKYSVYVKSDSGSKKLIHFGSASMQHYKDTTGVGAWSSKDHGDEERRKSFRARMSGIKTKSGGRAIDDKNSPAYWAYHKLW